MNATLNKLSKHEQAVAFADKHINLSDEEFWKLAEAKGFKPTDFTDEDEDEKTI